MSTTRLDAVIVGAGIAGLYQLYQMRQLGLEAQVIEAAEGVGGTWYWNRYPGARCDHPSLAYSYSFSPELEQEWTWTEKFATQPEILAYLDHVADRFDLRRDILFNTRVASATYLEEARRWRVVTDDGATFEAQYFIMATGCLSVVKSIEIAGMERFGGKTYHTGHWPHEAVDFTGQRVGVIGTGSSAVQAIPLFAEQARELVVFQRTPNFSLPAGNRPLSDTENAEMKANYRQYRADQRTSLFGIPDPLPTQSALEVSEAERQTAYEETYNSGLLTRILTRFTDTITDEKSNETAAEFIRDKIRSIVRDPEVAESLCPRDHPFGTKRPCLDTNYFETFNEEHVHLVDLRKTPLVEITERGVRTSYQEYELDAIVYATGFDAMTGALLSVDIYGRGGVSLKEEWRDGPETFLGLAVAGFPNMFTITGPTSPAVLSSMFVSIEQHVDWVTDCIAFLREHGVDEVEATVEAQQAWAAHAAEVANATLYPKANSWYMGANVAGKPRMLFAYIGGVAAYREQCETVAADGYRGFVLTPAPAAAVG